MKLVQNKMDSLKYQKFLTLLFYYVMMIHITAFEKLVLTLN